MDGDGDGEGDDDDDAAEAAELCAPLPLLPAPPMPDVALSIME